MASKIDHIGIFVKDLEKSMERFTSLLGLEVKKIEEVKVDGALDRLAFLPIGDADIELIHTTAETGFAADFIKAKGEAIHHIAFEVEDLDAIFERLRSQGVAFLKNQILDGSRGTRVAFFQPEEFNGIYIELVEKH
jgi:methylmalonyl-CoA/ethylmalonyl-CoA epimerase